MKLINKRMFIQTLNKLKIFDIKNYEGIKGEIVLNFKDTVRFINFELENNDISQIIEDYKEKEQFLITWVFNILSESKLKKIYFYPINGEWIKSKSYDPELLKCKDILKTYKVKNSCSQSILFNQENEDIKFLLRCFSISGFRGYSDILILLICEQINFVLIPCDHFDYHIYPSSLEEFISLSEKWKPSEEFDFEIKR